MNITVTKNSVVVFSDKNNQILKAKGSHFKTHFDFH